MTPKVDFLRECMSDTPGPVPIDQFKSFFCSRCIRSECSHSKTTSFDSRVKNWKKDLFDNPPRANDNDKSFEHIRSKRFLDSSEAIKASISFNTPTIQLENHTLNTIPEKTEQNGNEVIEETEKFENSSEILQQPVQFIKPVTQPVVTQPVVTQPVRSNPFGTGVMLGNAPTQVKIKEVVIESGGTFSFGGEDDK